MQESSKSFISINQSVHIFLLFYLLINFILLWSFLNDYSIIQVKFVFCCPPVLLIKVSHCISLILLYFYCPLQMFPCLINTLIINFDYYFILSFYSPTPAWLCFVKILLSHDNPGDFINGFFKFCNRNVNSLAKDNFQRIQLLEAHNSIFNYE